ncbi:tetratricopeptide repeat-containing sensor histidine kinase [Aquimarina macrocephali]|uniref:tetratricopeptide repeat-containing sensor histidine kinase n=1 Tax=Aquimarina macrocephali TaxID=666563 RepID=UPI0004674A07|nr:tetratricopeptide repeat protein [Aquimarina macrocephali]
MKLWRVDSFYIITIVLLILCSSIPVFGQIQRPLSQNELDSLARYYNLSKADSLSIPERLQHVSSYLKGILLSQYDSLIYNGFRQKTWLLSKTKQYDSAIVYTHQFYDLARRNQDTMYIVNALTKLGIYYKNNNQLTEAFKYRNENFKIFRISKDTIGAGRNLLIMANIQASLGDYSGCKTTAVDGVTYLEHTSELRNLAGLYHNIAVANKEQKNYSEALKYNAQALALGKDSTSIKTIGIKNILIFKNTKANILAGQGKYKQAISILKTLVSNTIVQHDIREYARVLSNLGYIQWLENKENKDSKTALLFSLEMRKEANDVGGLIASNIDLTKYYFGKDKAKALEYAEATYQYAKQRHSLKSTLEALGFIFELREATNDEAKEFKQIHDELEEANQSNREIYAVTRYENDKLTNENLILKAEKARKERQQVIYLFSTLFVFLIGGLVFYLYRQRLRREKIREVYNAEARISKKLHDELANDVYQVMMQMQNDQNDPEVLDKLEEIYHTTRDISREHNSFRTGEEYATELNGMLSSYSTNGTKIIIKDIDDINWQAINPEKKIIVHRTLQELMVNMKKHSHAELVAITFKKTSKGIVITYADTGVGVAAEEIIYSNGLQNTENRIKTIGGSFIFDSEKGKGFKAKINFPN